MPAEGPRRWLSRAAGFGLIVTTGALLAYGAWSVSRAARLYEFLKTVKRGWTARVFRPDGELGYAPIPGAVGGDMMPGAEPVPTRFDGQGFRVPAATTDRPGRPSPLVLALGDSFTYGAACRAEEAYPFLVAHALGGSELNAGSPSYGLAQVLLLARRLIPRHRPDLVLVQYSGQLVTRARSPYADSFFGVLTAPYFSADGGVPALKPPPFVSRALELPLAEFRTTPRGALDFASFLRRAGLPLLFHDDLQKALVAAKRRAGVLPDAVGEPEPIVRAVYSEIAALCRDHGCRMLIVLLGRPPSSERRAELARHGTLVDAEGALCRALDPACEVSTVTAAYLEAYAHFAGSPPVLVDSHPNPRAHAVIAAEVVKAIRPATPSRPARPRGPGAGGRAGP